MFYPYPLSCIYKILASNQHQTGLVPVEPFSFMLFSKHIKAKKYLLYSINLIWKHANEWFFLSSPKLFFISLNWYINKNPIKQNQNRYIFENNLVLFSPYFLIKLTVVHISFYPHLLRIYTFQNKAYIQAASVSLFIQLPSILYVWF